jgi:hypothetical protein
MKNRLILSLLICSICAFLGVILKILHIFPFVAEQLLAILIVLPFVILAVTLSQKFVTVYQCKQ